MNFKEASKYIQDQIKHLYSSREAQNISNLILESITSLTSTERLIAKDDELTFHQNHQLEIYIHQLLQFKPIQQILGNTWFCCNKFYVNEHVLIPRPETEELVELIIKEQQNSSLSVLDIGTGSGCIGISLKNKSPNFSVTAIDISAFALQIANKNATLLNAHIHLKLLDFLNEDSWKDLETYDIIVSNPPYIKESEQHDMQKNVLDHEPHLALFVPDNDALIFYKKIADFATHHLNKAGIIYVEINEALGIETAEVFISKGFQTKIINDFQQKDRIIKAWR